MKMPLVTRLGLTLLAICLLAACAGSRLGGSASPNESANEPSHTREPFETTSPLPSEARVDGPSEVPGAIWAAIVEALEFRVEGELDPADLELVSIESVTWNDGSLGCPKPGEAYTQALVDGFRVVVEVEGEEFDYRVPLEGEPKLCESELPRGG